MEKRLLPRLEFFFDCVSPWTYLAFVRVLKLADRVPVDLIWCPSLDGRVFNKVNADVYNQREMRNPVKSSYYRRDLKDRANFAGIKVIQPRVFPVRFVTAMRACLYAMGQSRLFAFASALFEAYWRDDKNISLDAEIIACAASAGLNGEAVLLAASAPEVKAALIPNVSLRVFQEIKAKHRKRSAPVRFQCQPFAIMQERSHPEYYAWSPNSGIVRTALWERLKPFAAVSPDRMSGVMKEGGLTMAYALPGVAAHIGIQRNVIDPTMPVRPKTKITKMIRAFKKQLYYFGLRHDPF
jgi:2-hydroxychromene-2-carboxylate isomerase